MSLKNCRIGLLLEDGRLRRRMLHLLNQHSAITGVMYRLSTIIRARYTPLNRPGAPGYCAASE